MARVISIVIIGIALMCVLAEEQFYSDQYDHIDPKEILDNDKLREQYYQCFMGSGPCVTADAKFFKGKSIFKAFCLRYGFFFMRESLFVFI